MRMKIVFEMLMCVLAAVSVVACGHDSPSERGPAAERPGDGQQPPSGDGAGQRPGIDDANSLKHELDDDVWRVEGPALSLRYDRGGVMFTTRTDGTIEVIDIDGADSACIITGKEGTDSVMSGASVVVNGRPVEISRVRMLRHGDGRSWYVATDKSAGQWVLVLP